MGLIWGLLATGLLLVGTCKTTPTGALRQCRPFALAWGLFLFKPPKIVGRLEETTLVFTKTDITIPYDSIESLSLAGRVAGSWR